MLPESWIERIFGEMSVLYGSKFADLWAGTDIAQVRAGWAKKLAGFEDHPKAIRAALDALEDKPFPPTLPEFIHSCREHARRLGSEQEKLEHKPTAEEQERADQAAKKAAAALRAMDNRDFLDWAKRPRSRIAFEEVRKLANATGQKADPRFREILDTLIADGRATADKLLMVWNCQDWVPA